MQMAKSVGQNEFAVEIIGLFPCILVLFGLNFELACGIPKSALIWLFTLSNIVESDKPVAVNPQEPF